MLVALPIETAEFVNLVSVIRSSLFLSVIQLARALAVQPGCQSRGSLQRRSGPPVTSKQVNQPHDTLNAPFYIVCSGVRVPYQRGRRFGPSAAASRPHSLDQPSIVIAMPNRRADLTHAYKIPSHIVSALPSYHGSRLWCWSATWHTRHTTAASQHGILCQFTIG